MDEKYQKGIEKLRSSTLADRDDPVHFLFLNIRYGLEKKDMEEYFSPRLKSILDAFDYVPEAFDEDIAQMLFEIHRVEDKRADKFPDEVYNFPARIIAEYVNIPLTHANHIVVEKNKEHNERRAQNNNKISQSLLNTMRESKKVSHKKEPHLDK